MVVSIAEIVDVVTSARCFEIVHRSLHRPLPRPRKISFQSWRTCVQHRQSISVIGPQVSKHLFKPLVRELLKGITLRLDDQSKSMKLLVKHFSREDTLHYVGPVEAVYAVCPDHSGLKLLKFQSVLVTLSQGLPLIEAYFHFTDEVPVGLQISLHYLE